MQRHCTKCHPYTNSFHSQVCPWSLTLTPVLYLSTACRVHPPEQLSSQLHMYKVSRAIVHQHHLPRGFYCPMDLTQIPNLAFSGIWLQCPDLQSGGGGKNTNACFTALWGCPRILCVRCMVPSDCYCYCFENYSATRAPCFSSLLPTVASSSPPCMFLWVTTLQPVAHPSGSHCCNYSLGLHPPVVPSSHA